MKGAKTDYSKLSTQFLTETHDDVITILEKSGLYDTGNDYRISTFLNELERVIKIKEKEENPW